MREESEVFFSEDYRGRLSVEVVVLCDKSCIVREPFGDRG